MAKSLQKYILSLAQQVATQQGHPLVISTLVSRLHRRLQNTGSGSSPQEGDEEVDEEAEGELFIDISSDHEEDKKEPIEAVRRTRAALKKVKRSIMRAKCEHFLTILSAGQAECPPS